MSTRMKSVDANTVPDTVKAAYERAVADKASGATRGNAISYQYYTYGTPEVGYYVMEELVARLGLIGATFCCTVQADNAEIVDTSFDD